MKRVIIIWNAMNYFYFSWNRLIPFFLFTKSPRFNNSFSSSTLNYFESFLFPANSFRSGHAEFTGCSNLILWCRLLCCIESHLKTQRSYHGLRSIIVKRIGSSKRTSSNRSNKRQPMKKLSENSFSSYNQSWKSSITARLRNSSKNGFCTGEITLEA